MTAVVCKEKETPEMLFRRFKRACDKAGIQNDIKKYGHYEKPTEERKRKKMAAVKRHWKKIIKENPRIGRSRNKKQKQK